LIKHLLKSAVLLVCAALVGLYVHFLSTGLTAHRYLNVGLDAFQGESTGVRRWIASTARAALLDTKLVSDPVDRYPPDLTTNLPVWAGRGASALQSDIAPRYTPDGTPIAIAQSNRWLLSSPPAMQVEQIGSNAALRPALEGAAPGTRFVLQPGRYFINETVRLSSSGSMDAPIALSAGRLGQAVLEFGPNGRLEISGNYWFIGNIVFRGQCRAGCAPLLRVTGRAGALTLRNVFVSGFEALAEGTSLQGDRLLDGITVLDGQPVAGNGGWRQSSVRMVSSGYATEPMEVLCPRRGAAHDCTSYSLQEALKNAAEGGLILMRAGIYREGARVRKRARILAEPGAVLDGGAVEGKGAIVVNSDLTLEGLECRNVSVRDGNGTCVRHQRGDAILINVHFHDSQMGILAGPDGNTTHIIDSYIHDSGSDGLGQLGHNVYVSNQELRFERSWSLSARNGGHEIKSRASRTLIKDSLIASLNARDSRLVDVPNAGLLEITGSVLGEGPRSENWGLIGYGLESRDGALPHPDNRIVLSSNTVYLDRPQGSQLLQQRHAGDILIKRNVVIGEWAELPGNTHFPTRQEAGVGPYPALQRLLY
jgi:hypothetical protein